MLNQIKRFIPTLWLLAILISGYFLFKSLPPSFWQWDRVEYGSAFLALGLYILTSGGQWWITHDIVKEQSADFHSPTNSFIMSFLPAIGKYIPGSIWSTVGFAVLAKTLTNLRFTVATSLQLYVMLISLASSALLALILAIFLSIINFSSQIRLLIFSSLIFMLIIFVVIQVLLQVNKKTQQTVSTKNIKQHTLAFAGQKVVRGIALFYFAKSFLIFDVLMIEIILSFVIAVQIGLIAIFAPAGLGVTEGAYVFLLSYQTSVEISLKIALLARMMQIITDIFLAVLAYILKVWNRL